MAVGLTQQVQRGGLGQIMGSRLVQKSQEGIKQTDKVQKEY